MQSDRGFATQNQTGGSRKSATRWVHRFASNNAFGQARDRLGHFAGLSFEKCGQQNAVETQLLCFFGSRLSCQPVAANDDVLHTVKDRIACFWRVGNVTLQSGAKVVGDGSWYFIHHLMALQY